MTPSPVEHARIREHLVIGATVFVGLLIASTLLLFFHYAVPAAFLSGAASFWAFGRFAYAGTELRYARLRNDEEIQEARTAMDEAFGQFGDQEKP